MWIDSSLAYITEGSGRNQVIHSNWVIEECLIEELFPFSYKMNEASLMAQWKRIHLTMRRRVFDPWVGKIPGRGNDNLLQYSCLGNPMDKGTWRATVHDVTKSQTWLSDYTTTRWIRSEDLMYNMVTLVDNSVVWLTFAKTIELKCSHTYKKR